MSSRVARDDEEIAPSATPRFSVRLAHSHRPHSVVESARRWFNHFVARTRGPVASGIAALDNEVGDHPVEVQAVVEARARQMNEGIHDHGEAMSIELNPEATAVGFDHGDHMVTASDRLRGSPQMLDPRFGRANLSAARRRP
jgi:hypothetical protein